MAYGGGDGFGRGPCNPKDIKQLEIEERKTYSLSINMNPISTYGTISNKKMNTLHENLQRELEALNKHAVYSNVHCLRFCTGVSLAKKCLLMNFAISSLDDLIDLYKCSRKIDKRELNELSRIVTDFFEQREIGVLCGFHVKEKLTFKIVLQEDVYKNVWEKLMDRAPRTTDDKVQRNNENVRIKKTFVCHIPKEIQGNVHEIRIIGVHPQAVNAPMQLKSNNMYTVDLQLSANDQFEYSYEVKLIKQEGYRILGYRKTRQYKGYTITKSDGNFIRDVLSKPDGIIAHLNDVIVYDQDKFSYGDLLWWANRFCSDMSKMDVKKCAESLLSESDYDEESTIRLALVLYQLTLTCSESYVPLKDIITSAFAKKCIEYLRHKKCSEFSRDYQLFVSEACLSFYYIGSSKSSCTFDFIDKFWTFFEKKDLLEILQNKLNHQDQFLSQNCQAKLVERGKELIEKLVNKNDDVLTEILKIFILECPLEFVLELVVEVNQNEKLSIQEDILTEINKHTKWKLLNAIQMARRSTRLIDLLKKATKVMAYEDIYGIKNEVEKTILDLFHCSQEVNVNDLLKATVDCLKHSSCFVTDVGQINLIKSIIESNSRDVHSLFPVLLNEENLVDIFMQLETVHFKSWFNKEFRDTYCYGREKIVKKIAIITPVLQSNIVRQRKEVIDALKEAFIQWIYRFDIMDMIKSIADVDKFAENEPDIISFFKQTVQQFLCHNDRNPSDILQLFCQNKDQLIVDDRLNVKMT